MSEHDPLPFSLNQSGMGRSLEERMTRCELQVDRHGSMLDSEAGTRARAHKILHDRLTAQDQRLIRIERAVWMIGGGIMVLEFILRLKP